MKTWQVFYTGDIIILQVQMCQVRIQSQLWHTTQAVIIQVKNYQVAT